MSSRILDPSRKPPDSRPSDSRPYDSRPYDAVVVGAGFGGLAAALEMSRAGARVLLCETLKYPGGCASTFSHRGLRFEAGATLFSGFGHGQLFRRWIDELELDVAIDWIDPLVELRTPDWRLPVPRDRGAFLDRLLDLPSDGEPRPVPGLLAFFGFQERAADALWALLDDPGLLPPFGPRALARHALRLPGYLPLARFVGRPLEAVLRHYGVAKWRPLRTFLDAVCQITVQCSAAEAEASFALGAMDYYFRGTGHVRGGIGSLATALADAVERTGGEVAYTRRVHGMVRDADGLWNVDTRRGLVRARAVVANVLPAALRTMLQRGAAGASGAGDESLRRLDALDRRVASGWGACMLYRVVDPPTDPSAHHVEIVQDPDRPQIEGNHLFASLSGAADGGRAPDGRRTLTVSTHVPMAKLLALSTDRDRGDGTNPRGRYVAEIQQRMAEGLEQFAPEWGEAASRHFADTASPRTFERFTGRPHGYVGGIPRRAGLGHYLHMSQPPVAPGLFLVGDSVFPGQSTLATALGGARTARRVLTAL